MRNVWMVSGLLLGLGALMSACGGSDRPSGDVPGNSEDGLPGAIVIGMSQCNLGEPWRVQMNADIKAAAAHHPQLTVLFKDAQNDTLRQRAHIEEFVNQGVDVLICSPKEAAPLTEPLKKAYEAGIPVVVLDRAVFGDAFTQFIGADNTLIGEAAGRWASLKLGGEGKVVELKGLMTSAPGQDRNTGFRAGIAESNLEVVFEADMEWLGPRAREEMESALARFEHIDLVYGHNDPAAQGAYLAAKAAGREKDIIFVGIDGLPQEGQVMVREGVLDVCFEYPTGGAQAITTALEVLEGKEVPREIVLPSRYFTADNLEGGGEWLEKPSDVKAKPRVRSGS